MNAEQLGYMILGQRCNGVWEPLTSVVVAREAADSALEYLTANPLLIGHGEKPVAYQIATISAGSPQ